MPRTEPNWFVALAVPTDGWWQRVRRPPDGVRLFSPADVHITVAFLGPCGQQAAEAAFELAPHWPTGPVDVRLGAVEAMGNPRRPSALAAVVGFGGALLTAAIASLRDTMCETAGVRPDPRPPLPHATIARPSRSATPEQRRAAVAWARGLDLGQPYVRLSRIALYTRAEDRTLRLFREHAGLELTGHGDGRSRARVLP
jgi:2'-5' RNA ligase